jgi:hypothetical protein
MERLEKAAQFEQRGVTAAWLKALKRIHELQPPCARCRRATATSVIGGDNPRAVCRDCRDQERLDQRAAANKAEREAMRRRA